MALQDLTPQLRTRLNRVERLVGMFLTLATLLFLAGFAYYVYHSGVRKGWFVTKVQYHTSVNSAAGLRVGNDVVMMGFPAGRITAIVPNAPNEWYNVTVYFEIYDSRDGPYYGYIWTDSQVRLAAADLLGNRNLEVIKGTAGVPTVRIDDGQVAGILQRDVFLNQLADRETRLLHEGYSRVDAQNLAMQQMRAAVDADPDLFYAGTTNIYWLTPVESPAITERAEQILSVVEGALPNLLTLTNQLAAVLDQSASATARAEELLANAKPLIDNLNEISTNLRDPDGSLGRWLLSAGTMTRVDQTLTSADSTLRSTDTVIQNADAHLAGLIESAQKSLDNLASLTGSLNAQVEGNTNILADISQAVVSANELVEGLKRHWLLRSAFRDDEPGQAPPPARPRRPLAPPRFQ